MEQLPQDAKFYKWLTGIFCSIIIFIVGYTCNRFIESVDKLVETVMEHEIRLVKLEQNESNRNR